MIRPLSYFDELKPGLILETNKPLNIWKGAHNLNLLSDRFDRRFSYLRLSITDICNFQCGYCLPDGYQKTGPNLFLTVDEIIRLVRAFAGLGLSKIRLTGGEPTLRKDFLTIVQSLALIPGVKKIAVTTNGFNLPERIVSYRTSGITDINISVDSLTPQLFKQITGHDKLAEILEGIKIAEGLGFDSLKINAVLLKNVNDHELDLFLAWIKNKKITVRFIELMQTGDNHDYFKAHHISSEVIQKVLLAQGWSLLPRSEGAGPAITYSHPDFMGSVGIIAPYSKDFCTTCNRLRVTARGDLRLCLFGESGYNLRSFCQRDEDCEALQEKVLSLMHFKSATHYLREGKTGITPHLASLGG